MGSLASPTTPIWKKWSITQRLAKPPSSAVLPISANFGPIEPGASGQVKRGTCNPMRTAGPSLLSRDGSIASPPIVPTNNDILRAFVSMHNSQHPVVPQSQNGAQLGVEHLHRAGIGGSLRDDSSRSGGWARDARRVSLIISGLIWGRRS